MTQNHQVPPDKTISGETFSQPYRPESEVITNPEIYFKSVPFPIGEADYVYLTKTISSWSEWAVRLVIGSVALAAPTVWKQILSALRGQEQTVELSDYGAVAVTLFAAFVFWCIGKKSPNGRDRVMKNMKTHFDNSQPELEVRRRS